MIPSLCDGANPINLHITRGKGESRKGRVGGECTQKVMKLQYQFKKVY